MGGLALRETGMSLSDLSALGRVADESGVSTVWIPEHASRDAIVLASLIGAGTKRLRVGTGVVPLYARGVVSLAMACASASEASRGRFILGIGTGHRASAESWYSSSWTRPRSRLRETISVLRRLLDGERVTHNGQVRVEGFQLTSKPPAVPVYIGALTPASLRLAGEVADGVILNWMPPEHAARCALLAREAAKEAGRSVRVVAYVRVAVLSDPDDADLARKALREQTYVYASLPVYAASMRNCGLGDELDRLASGEERALDVLARRLCVMGDRDTVRSALQDYREAGIDEVVAYPIPFGDEPAQTMLRAVRAIGDV